MRRLTYKILIILIALTCFKVFAKIDGSIECTISRQDRSFIIKNNSITFYQQQIENIRTIASLGNVRTKLTMKGFTKITTYEGHKYSFHIENTENFNESDDYVEIKSRLGHNIVYPINCQLK